MKKLSEILSSDKYLNGKFFGDGVVRRTVLDRCTHEKSILTLKIIPTNRADDPWYPRFIPQIKQSCCNCGKYLKFVAQSPELIAKFNQKLQEVAING